MNVQRLAAVGSTVVVIAAALSGLWLTGSPLEQRLRRLDEQRVNELRVLASTAERRWDGEQRLPETADHLVDGQYLTRLPTDPSTGEPYEYRVTAPRQFEVCATFDRPSRPENSGDFWFHEAGHRCFTFEMRERRD